MVADVVDDEGTLHRIQGLAVLDGNGAAGVDHPGEDDVDTVAQGSERHIGLGEEGAVDVGALGLHEVDDVELEAHQDLVHAAGGAALAINLSGSVHKAQQLVDDDLDGRLLPELVEGLVYVVPLTSCRVGLQAPASEGGDVAGDLSKSIVIVHRGLDGENVWNESGRRNMIADP